MVERRVQVCIAAVANDDGLHGRICRAGEPATDFTGWLGLITSLDRLLPDADEDGGADTGPAGDADTGPAGDAAADEMSNDKRGGSDGAR